MLVGFCSYVWHFKLCTSIFPSVHSNLHLFVMNKACDSVGDPLEQKRFCCFLGFKCCLLGVYSVLFQSWK